MRSSLLVLATVLIVAAAPAGAGQSTSVLVLPAAQDISLPFWCDWGYDWDERCYRDDGDRLPIGGDEDKLWRAALRFQTTALPSDARIVSARLRLFHDARCLGPRKTLRICGPGAYELEAHEILSADWFHERELELGPAITATEIPSADVKQWLAFDLSELVADWVEGARPNRGVILKLDDAQETYGSGGPKPPSSTFADTTSRPRLVVTYVGPTA
jgi:hypothetical protein